MMKPSAAKCCEGPSVSRYWSLPYGEMLYGVRSIMMGYFLVVLASFGIMVFFLLLATLQTPAGAPSAVRLLTTLAVSLAVMGMFWLAARR